MQNHCKNYNGVSLKDSSLCENCGLSLANDEEVSLHSDICNGANKALDKSSSGACKSLNLTQADDRSKKWETQIKTFGQAFCDNQDCNFVSMTLSDLENHFKSCKGVPNYSLFCCIHCRCGFSTKEDHLKHQQNCNVTIKFDNSVQKRGDSLHFRVIKRMKSSESGEDHIIQPMPDFPKGQYRRRRPYSVQHIKSWVLSLEKYKYVKCIYQNCYFVAMSLEDMISHFGYCNGDGNFAKFVCPHCNGRLTSEVVLQKHIERSHPLENNHCINLDSVENNHIKVEPQAEENNDGILFTDMESHNVEELNKEIQKNSSENEDSNEVTKIRQSACWRVWKREINEFGYAYCRKSLCNLMAPSIPVLEVHLRTCDGTPDFEFLNCPKCRYRLPTREDLLRHVPKCKDDRMKYYPAGGCEIADLRNNGLEEENVFDVGPVFRQDSGKSVKFYSKSRKESSVATPDKSLTKESLSKNENPENVNDLKSSKKDSSPKKRGRPKGTAGNNKAEKTSKSNHVVKCGKCGNFQGTKKYFDEHNVKVHVGLGWVEGEVPVDMNDEKLVIRLVKEAFKVSKKAMCEKCDDVKRSVMGFVSHIQNCGKSEEEKNALRVPCPYCDGKYLKYSLSTHIKFCRSTPQEDEEKHEVEEETPEPSGKRRSAIKAVSKFQQVLGENDEGDANRENHYIFYEKGNERMPKLNSKLNNLWYKLKRENKKIPCRYANCNNLSSDVREAKNHHYNCPLLPEKVFLCETCDFYSVEELVIQNHVTTHRKYAKHRKAKEEDADVKVEDEINENDEDDENDDNEDDEGVDEEEFEIKSSEEDLEDDEPRRKKLKKGNSGYEEDMKLKRGKFSAFGAKTDLDIENRLKQIFCKKEKIDSLRGSVFYSNGLGMTLEEELSKKQCSELWPELHSSLEDWIEVSPEQALECFPELTESVSVRFFNNDQKWRRFKRFGSDLIEGVPILFTGGSVRSMSWCKVSFERMIEKNQRQYLAVSTAKNANNFRDVHDRSSVQKSTLLQIWDCGPLHNALSEHSPKFSLGIMHPGGEIWDLAWFPEDTKTEGTNDKLGRIGLLATASEDRFVRIWSICDPKQLNSIEGLPIYKTEPSVMLTADQDDDESCLQVAVGLEGVIAGGFGNGAVALWNLKSLSSPFCKKLGKSKAIRAHMIVQAHKTAITALSFCPLNSRYFSTAGLDRFVKVWDTEFPLFPIEQYNKESSLDNIWTLNWPLLIHNFDDVVLNFNKGVIKFIKDIVTERHQSSFAMEDTCLSMTFSDWLNALCAGSITGEVKLRLLKNLIYDQKRSQSTISSVGLEKLDNDESKNDALNSGKGRETEIDRIQLKTYDDVNTGFGLVFRDYLGVDKGKPKKPEAHPETFAIRAINKVAFNPNLASFTHIALGYNCGLIRILPLKELQSTRSVKFFLEKAQKKRI